MPRRTANGRTAAQARPDVMYLVVLDDGSRLEGYDLADSELRNTLQEAIEDLQSLFEDDPDQEQHRIYELVRTELFAGPPPRRDNIIMSPALQQAVARRSTPAAPADTEQAS